MKDLPIKSEAPKKEGKKESGVFQNIPNGCITKKVTLEELSELEKSCRLVGWEPLSKTAMFRKEEK